MRPETSWLVDGKLVPVPEKVELFPYYPGHSWFEPDVDHLAGALTEIASDWDAARAKAAPARADLIERFGPDATAARIVELAEEALERVAPTVLRPPLAAVRGEFGATASLAVVNDGLVEALRADGHSILQRSRRSDRLQAEVPGVTHSWPPDFAPVTGGPTVMILPWEFGAPPSEWVRSVREKIDRVWVPSAYVRDGYVAAGMPPGAVEVVPNGVDLETFTPDGPARPLERSAGTVFLFVGGTTWRKGVDLLVEAWRRAFSADDDVLLVIKDFGTASHYRGQTNGEAIRRAAEDPAVAPILYIDDDLPQSELPALYRAADALVVPYRGEGFCLPALEAMACGLPVVHTGTGPTAEFVPADGGWAVPAERTPVPADANLPTLAGEGYVQEPSLPELALALRAAAESQDERIARGAVALEAARRLGWDAVAEIAHRSLEALVAEDLRAARHVSDAEVEGRENVVVYAPDWSDEESWPATLRAWAATFDGDDPVTLALYPGGEDPEALAARIMPVLESADAGGSLPDLALCAGDVPLDSLVAGTCAALVDAGTEPRLEIARRAPRIATPAAADLAELRRVLLAAERAVAA
jgi:glycosyltransferase involved in cell wall biosynthesis